MEHIRQPLEFPVGGVIAGNAVRALDVSEWSGPTTARQWRAAVRKGTGIAIVKLGTEHTGQQLAAARSGGVGMLAGYLVVPGHSQVDIPGGLGFVAIDVEENGVTPVDLHDAEASIRAAGSEPIIYTSRSIWGRLKLPPSSLELWDAAWGEKPGAGFRQYGSWIKRVGHQYGANINRFGFLADASVFDRGWLHGLIT